MNPIEAKVRKGKGAVGAYGNERTQQSLQDFPVVDSEEEEEKVHLSKARLLSYIFVWKVTHFDAVLNYCFFLYIGISEGARPMAKRSRRCCWQEETKVLLQNCGRVKS